MIPDNATIGATADAVGKVAASLGADFTKMLVLLLLVAAIAYLFRRPLGAALVKVVTRPDVWKLLYDQAVELHKNEIQAIQQQQQLTDQERTRERSKAQEDIKALQVELQYMRTRDKVRDQQWMDSATAQASQRAVLQVYGRMFRSLQEKLPSEVTAAFNEASRDAYQ